MNISELYGKKAVSTDGKEGYVISVNAAGGKIECLTCADRDENEFIIDMKNIVSLGDKIIFEDRESKIKAARPVRLGRAGFDEKGKYLGGVSDFKFKGSKIISAKIGNKSYSGAELIYGDVVIVKQMKKLKESVLKDGKTIIKKGTVVTDEVMSFAEKEGESIQTSLKSI